MINNHTSRSGVYVGSVMHQRYLPKKHFLKYNLFSLFIDLDDLELLDQSLWCFSIDKFNIVSFNHKDYGDRSKHLKKIFWKRLSKIIIIHGLKNTALNNAKNIWLCI